MKKKQVEDRRKSEGKKKRKIREGKEKREKRVQ